jgi:hypothetical protein
MWNFDPAVGRTPMNYRRAAFVRRPLPASQFTLLWTLLLVLAVILSIGGMSHGISALNASTGDNASSPASPAAALPACDPLCMRIQQVYHDTRTQELLLLLAQTPTGQGALEYLLAMGAHFGDAFISWRDLRADGNVGENSTGGFIQLDSARHTERILIRIYLAGILVHEAVESYFDVGEGMRAMDTRHTDYVAQWFNGKFERELHALPDYHALDPYYMPTEGNAYGFTYDAWLNNTNDGQLYLGEPAGSDLQQSDRLGRAWPPSDWLAESGGFWLLGQGTDVSPVPNPLGLTAAMLAADDLSLIG